MSPFVRNGGMEPSDGERGGRVEFGSWAALNARFDKILFRCVTQISTCSDFKFY